MFRGFLERRCSYKKMFLVYIWSLGSVIKAIIAKQKQQQQETLIILYNYQLFHACLFFVRTPTFQGYYHIKSRALKELY